MYDLERFAVWFVGGAGFVARLLQTPVSHFLCKGICFVKGSWCQPPPHLQWHCGARPLPAGVAGVLGLGFPPDLYYYYNFQTVCSKPMPENREYPTQRDGSLFLVGVFGIRSFSRDMKPARRVEDGARLFIFFALPAKPRRP